MEPVPERIRAERGEHAGKREHPPQVPPQQKHRPRRQKQVGDEREPGHALVDGRRVVGEQDRHRGERLRAAPLREQDHERGPGQQQRPGQHRAVHHAQPGVTVRGVGHVVDRRQSAREHHAGVLAQPLRPGGPSAALQPGTGPRDRPRRQVKEPHLRRGPQVGHDVRVEIAAQEREAGQQHHHADAHEPRRTDLHFQAPGSGSGRGRWRGSGGWRLGFDRLRQDDGPGGGRHRQRWHRDCNRNRQRRGSLLPVGLEAPEALFQRRQPGRQEPLFRAEFPEFALLRFVHRQRGQFLGVGRLQWTR